MKISMFFVQHQWFLDSLRFFKVSGFSKTPMFFVRHQWFLDVLIIFLIHHHENSRESRDLEDFRENIYVFRKTPMISGFFTIFKKNAEMTGVP